MRNQPATGIAPLDFNSSAVGDVSVRISGVPAEVTFAGLVPGYVGIYQVNAVFPAGVPGSGTQLIIEKILPLKALESGQYTLNVKAEDKNRNQTVLSSANFTVK